MIGAAKGLSMMGWSLVLMISVPIVWMMDHKPKREQAPEIHHHRETPYVVIIETHHHEPMDWEKEGWC